MALGKWLHELFNPHCPHCKEEREIAREESHFCDSCESLKTQLALKNEECRLLLSKVLKEPEPVIVEEPVRIPTKPKSGVPWKVLQRHLEAEDRAKARSMDNAAKPDAVRQGTVVDVADLEKELNIASAEREQQGA